MQYRSPYHTISLLGISFEEAKDLDMATLRKRLLLELDIVTDGGSGEPQAKITKNDILELIADLETEQRWRFHDIIYQNQALLLFLAEGKISEKTIEALESAGEEEAFTAFLTPYLIYSVNRLLKKHYLKRDFVTCQQLVTISLYIPYSERSAAYDLFAGALNETTSELDDVISETLRFQKERYAYLTESELIRFLNHLPAEFRHKRDTFAYRINSLASLIHEEHRQFATKLFENWQHIDCISELDEMFRHNLRYMKSLSGKEKFYTAILWTGGAILLFMFIKFISLVFFTSDAERYRHHQRQTLSDHLGFADQLRAKVAWPGDTAYRSSERVPDRPYTYIYSQETDRSQVPTAPMVITNRSDAYAVVFRISDREKFALTIAPDSTVRSQIALNDILQIYTGNLWTADDPIPANVLHDYPYDYYKRNNGYFMQMSSRQQDLFNTLYKYNGEKFVTFDSDKAGNLVRYDRYEDIVQKNDSLFSMQKDLLVTDSVKVTIFEPATDSMVYLQPFYHFLN